MIAYLRLQTSPSLPLPFCFLAQKMVKQTTSNAVSTTKSKLMQSNSVKNWISIDWQNQNR